MMGFGWGMGFMWIWPIFLILIGVAIYYAINSSRHENHSHSHRDYYSSKRSDGRAVEILKERYAKGEITKEQFNEMRKELES